MAPFSLSKIAALIGLFASTASVAVPYAHRNLIVDGAFDTWTVNATAAAATTIAYGPAVMFYSSAGAGGAATVSRADIRTNLFGGYTDSNPKYAYNHNQTTNSTGSLGARTLPCIGQNIEGVQKLSGKSVTLSCKMWLSAGSPITIPAILAGQNFGTGGSPSAAVILDKAVNWQVTTTPKRFSVRVDFPSVISKTLGTAGNDSTTIGMWFPGGATYNLNVEEFQVEFCDPSASSDTTGAGGSPTTYEYRGEQAELARVQRYYLTIGIGSSSVFSIGTVASTVNAYGMVYFSVPMRAIPAGSIISAVTWNGGGLTGASVSLAPPSASCSAVVATGSGGTAGQSGYFAGNASGGSVLVFDARL